MHYFFRKTLGKVPNTDDWIIGHTKVTAFCDKCKYKFEKIVDKSIIQAPRIRCFCDPSDAYWLEAVENFMNLPESIK